MSTKIGENHLNSVPIVGGMFGLQPLNAVENCEPPFMDEHVVCLANGRSAIAVLVESLKPRRVWLPSYLCHTMIEAVKRAGVSFRLYPVSDRLTVIHREWIREVEQGDVVLLIDYFGFLFDESIAVALREQGAWIVEDACQALLTEGVGEHADYVVYSPRKFVGVPDGGILRRMTHASALDVTLSSAPPRWSLLAHSAAIQRSEFDIHGGDRKWYELYQQAESCAPIGNYRMGELTQLMLSHCFDYQEVARRRIENYRTLAGLIGEVALFRTLEDGVVPLGFPIRVEHRDQVLHALFEKNIYPPVHWRLSDWVPEEFPDSHRLASEIMTLPCDQRYDSEMMVQMAFEVQRAVEDMIQTPAPTWVDPPEHRNTSWSRAKRTMRSDT